MTRKYVTYVSDDVGNCGNREGKDAGEERKVIGLYLRHAVEGAQICEYEKRGTHCGKLEEKLIGRVHWDCEVKVRSHPRKSDPEYENDTCNSSKRGRLFGKYQRDEKYYRHCAERKKSNVIPTYLFCWQGFDQC